MIIIIINNIMKKKFRKLSQTVVRVGNESEHNELI